MVGESWISKIPKEKDFVNAWLLKKKKKKVTPVALLIITLSMALEKIYIK